MLFLPFGTTSFRVRTKVVEKKLMHCKTFNEPHGILLICKYGDMYVPNFLYLYIAHLRRRNLNYDVLN